MNMNQYENLVFEGGGAKGIAFCGALRSLSEHGIIKNIKRIAGSSAGSIVAGAIAVGYNYNEVQDILIDADFNKFKDTNYGVVGYLYRLLNYYGLYLGDYFYEWYGKLIKIKTGNIDFTLKDVYDKYGVELVITGTCVNKSSVVYFNHNDNPDMPVRLAVRISMSMPYVFESIKYKGNIYVDGGVLDNYPIWYFGNDNKTLGLKLVNPTERRDNQIFHTNTPINNIKDFSYNIINGMLEQIERLHINDTYWQHTITINTLGVYATEFDIAKDTKKKLIDSGYNCTNEFITSYPKMTKTSLLLQMKKDKNINQNEEVEERVDEEVEEINELIKLE